MKAERELRRNMTLQKRCNVAGRSCSCAGDIRIPQQQQPNNKLLAITQQLPGNNYKLLRKQDARAPMGKAPECSRNANLKEKWLQNG